ncbi:hypothetical protein [Dyadobacter sp. LHD-138]|uniref:hypothetical protein n=1 Tax=Dyadobacter sp. LHD-138 TaxID=3071413 RepID=UPI0027DF9724|nr:hypothetical protein [Dyadobacter sp. LHD-138]MDQ6482591.1 hypothetical protein [Dyadobacter sp. LHD-138]
MIALALLFILAQCTSDDIQSEQCNCESATVTEENKDVEAVVVFIQGNNPNGNQGPDNYVLSNDSADFKRSSHVAGPNILVPCDSLSTNFRKQGLKVLISYKRKDCYGAITQPTLHGNYGYFVDLTAIKAKNL